MNIYSTAMALKEQDNNEGIYGLLGCGALWGLVKEITLVIEKYVILDAKRYQTVSLKVKKEKLHACCPHLASRQEFLRLDTLCDCFWSLSLQGPTCKPT